MYCSTFNPKTSWIFFLHPRDCCFLPRPINPLGTFFRYILFRCPAFLSHFPGHGSLSTRKTKIIHGLSSLDIPVASKKKHQIPSPPMLSRNGSHEITIYIHEPERTVPLLKKGSVKVVTQKWRQIQNLLDDGVAPHVDLQSHTCVFDSYCFFVPREESECTWKGKETLWYEENWMKYKSTMKFQLEGKFWKPFVWSFEIIFLQDGS